MRRAMMEARATRPTVRPTAWPVFRDELLDCTAWLLGGSVGVMVMVWRTPVTVSTEVMGVGVHVGDELAVERAVAVELESFEIC